MRPSEYLNFDDSLDDAAKHALQQEARASAACIVAASLLAVDDVLAGRQTWTHQQLQLFKLLLNKVLPDA